MEKSVLLAHPFLTKLRLDSNNFHRNRGKCVLLAPCVKHQTDLTEVVSLQSRGVWVKSDSENLWRHLERRN